MKYDRDYLQKENVAIRCNTGKEAAKLCEYLGISPYTWSIDNKLLCPHDWQFYSAVGESIIVPATIVFQEYESVPAEFEKDPAKYATGLLNSLIQIRDHIESVGGHGSIVHTMATNALKKIGYNK